MKSLILGMTLLVSFSALAGEYCLAFRSTVPYSSKIEYKGNCNGKTLRASTGWFGSYENGYERFSAHLKKNGYKLLSSFSDRTIAVFSKNPAVVAPACIVEARYLGRCSYSVDCSGEESNSIEIPFSKTALKEFLNAYRYKPMQSWATVGGFRESKQCKGLDRYLVLGKK